jgi:outer membrane protein OmpA-like peptidoglycan-associated protein
MSSRTKATMLALGASTICTLAATGCASTPPPRELVDARRSYDRAHDGPARELVPAELLTAQQALNRAEQSFLDDPDSPRTRDLAYIAQRKAQIAEAQGAVAGDQRDKARAELDLGHLQTWTQQRTQAELSRTRDQVAAQGQMLATQQEQLTAEQRARHEADRRASAALASLEKIAAVKEEARGMVITLSGSVLFASGQSTLLPIARDRLQQVARALQDNDPDSTFVVEGHTDSVGSQSMNDELSLRRAEAVRAYLVDQGVEATRIRALGLGPGRPVADNKTPDGRANNRRVEIVIERARGAR